MKDIFEELKEEQDYLIRYKHHVATIMARDILAELVGNEKLAKTFEALYYLLTGSDNFARASVERYKYYIDLCKLAGNK